MNFPKLCKIKFAKFPVLALLSLFYCVKLFPQDIEFENLSTKHGLSQSDVNCIFQDRQGFMWFATNDGLNRFDGYEFLKYQYEVNLSNGLSCNIIRSIEQHRNHDIWIGTANGGVNLMKNLTDSIQFLSIAGGEFDLLEKEYIAEIAMVDDLAIVMTKEDLFFFRHDGNSYHHVKVNNEPYLKTGSRFTNCYYPVSANEILIGTKHGLKVLNIQKNESLQATITSHNVNQNIYTIVPFREGYLMSCLHNYLYYVDKELSFKRMIKRDINCILVEDERNIWVGSDFGLDYLSFENDTSLSVASVVKYDLQSTKGAIGGNRVQSIYKDRSGIIWIGTNGAGVTKVISRQKKFNHFYNTVSENYERFSITCFLEDSEGKLWLGTSGGNLCYFDANIYDYNKECVEVLDLQKPHGIRLLYELKVKGESYIIVANDYSTRVQVLDLKGNVASDVFFYDFIRTLGRSINAIAVDKDFMWIGTKEGGLVRYNLSSKSYKRFLVKNTPNLCSNLITSIFVDSSSNLVIGTNKGLNLLFYEEWEKPDPNFLKFTNSNKQNNSLTYNHVTSITQDIYNNIWIGTQGGGLNRFDPYQGTFSSITSNDGLASNSIKAMTTDNENHLWISSNNGLSSIDLSSFEITNYSAFDGLQDSEFKQKACFKRENGELLFGGDHGFNSFIPRSMKKDSTKSELVFTGLHLVGASAGEDIFYNSASLLKYVQDSTFINFKYNEKSFTVHFSSLNYIAPAEVEYKYRLFGFEEKWNNSNHRSRFAKYTNLHNGDYTLQVLATNSDGVWMKTPLCLNIKISKAWYKTNLALLFYSLLLIGIFIFFYRVLLIRNNMKNELLMERFEKEKLNQLTQLKFQFFTNISHEFRTPLTIIKSYFDYISPKWNKLPAEKINNDFATISRNIVSLSRLTDQLLDFRKLEQGKMEILPQRAKIFPLLESIISSFNLAATVKNIELSLDTSCQEAEFSFDKEKMEVILNNIISNGIKYTPENGKVTIRLFEVNEEIIIEIEDNGIGISEKNQKVIFERFYIADNATNVNGRTGIGLSLTKGLVELHHGRIELESKEGKGSIFRLFFNKESGTDHNRAKDASWHELNYIDTQDAKEIILSNEGLQQIEPKKYSILVIEDNIDLQNFLVERLSDSFTVFVADNGQLGLEKCIEKIPDLVISDIMMPEMNGYELCTSIKNNDNICHIPVILLTAKASDEFEFRGFKMGADAYVRKPFNYDVLLARVISILNSRQKLWERIEKNPFFKPSEVTFTAKDEQFLSNITSIIEKHMSNSDFSVEQLAENYSISTLNLNNKIKALTGKTTVQFIRLMRLRRAAELLKVNHNRVADVTYDVGYSDLQHFRTHFKKEFSITPVEFKNKYSSEQKKQ